MESSIFLKQLAFELVIENKDKFKEHKDSIVLGMGGSHLAADLLGLRVHSDYGLPSDLADKKDILIIAVSYSGNTEETLDGFNLALSKYLPLAVISTGGKLLELARQNNIPYIQLPNIGIQPRETIGFQLKALLKLTGKENELQEIAKLSNDINLDNLELQGRELAEKIKNYIPIIYSSAKNKPLAYFWKIVFNETAKIPAFYNVFSELNHNEIEGFNWNEKTKHLSEKFIFIFLKDNSDNPRIIKRMELTEKIYKNKGFNVHSVILGNKTEISQLLASIYIALATAYSLALIYGSDPQKTDLIDELKTYISQ